ncbi:hypothetical protein LCGC14_0685910 [marine sediment metagenome]|uniref:Uncharacterized protein n=1 Tax=marine sediment metagenome TaxID=412755 RepID=A0A0F9TUS8_9ZZZZ
MATSLATNLSMTLKTNHTTTDTDLSTPADVMTRAFSDTLQNGVVIDTADLVYHDSGSLASAAVDIDVAGGISDEFGNVITMVKVKAFLVINTSTTAGYILEVGGDANAVPLFGAVADFTFVNPGGMVFWWDPSLAGYAVTGGTGDILQISSVTAAQTVTYDVVIIGTSA